MTISNRQVTDALKLHARCSIKGAGCIDTHTDTLPDLAALYEFDHIDPSTKYRTKSGNTVNPSDLIKGNRYSLATVLAEVAKCRVVCVVCHRIYTHLEQRSS